MNHQQNHRQRLDKIIRRLPEAQVLRDLDVLVVNETPVPTAQLWSNDRVYVNENWYRAASDLEYLTALAELNFVLQVLRARRREQGE